MEQQVSFYNKQVEALENGAKVLIRSPSEFKWDGTAEQRAKRGILAEVRPEGFRIAVYRPFFRQHYYMDRVLNNSVYQLPDIFPSLDAHNSAIIVERGLPAHGRSTAVLAIDTPPSDKVGPGASGRACQVLPRYTFDNTVNHAQGALLADEGSRRDNISDEALAAYRSRYGGWVTKDHIFAYVYGVLHSPDYRERYANDLARMLPRIPEVSTEEAFALFSRAGNRLLDLHVGYEKVEPYPLEERLVAGGPVGPERYRVRKMRWGGSARGL